MPARLTCRWFLKAGAAALIAVAPGSGASREASAHDYPWCIAATRFSGDDCAYVTRDQCKAASGGFGSCIRNYAVPDPADKLSKSSRPPHKRDARGF